jgi:predicted peptidase
MKILLSVLVAACCFTGPAKTQDTAIYRKKVFYKGNDSLPYRLLLPQYYEAGKKYPLVLFLHGAGERGSDNIKQLTWGSRLFLQDSIRTKFPAIVVFPQCPVDGYWSNVKQGQDDKGRRTFEFQPGGPPTKAMDLAIDLEKQLIQTFPVDSTRIYVMGLSMGGMGTYEIIRRIPNTFAAAIPICGGADTTTAKAIHKTAFWIFHGTKDDVVPVHFSRDILRALQAFYSAGEMQYTEYPTTGHNSWEKAFAEPDLLSWLFSQRKER